MSQPDSGVRSSLILGDMSWHPLVPAWISPRRLSGADYVILITGGTGSFGQAFTRYLLDSPSPPRIRIYSRDEAKQEDMLREFGDNSRLTFIIGDVRDAAKLRIAMDSVDAVVHAAALKRVPAGEQHADEFAKTNVTGTQNVIEAALLTRVPRCLFISSDKAVEPVNAYGLSKGIAERIFVQANRLGVTRKCHFSVVRGGNVWGSRGSVVERWREETRMGKRMVVTDPTATRFHLDMQSWCLFVSHVLETMHGGEIFVPKLRAWGLDDLARAFGRAPSDVNGRRDGDKRHEWLISSHEIERTVDADWAYVIESPDALRQVWNYIPWPGRKVDADFQYSSDCTPRLTIEELRGLMNG